MNFLALQSVLSRFVVLGATVVADGGGIGEPAFLDAVVELVAAGALDERAGGMAVCDAILALNMYVLFLKKFISEL